MITRLYRFVARCGTDAGADHDQVRCASRWATTPGAWCGLRPQQRPFELSPVRE